MKSKDKQNTKLNKIVQKIKKDLIKEGFNKDQSFRLAKLQVSLNRIKTKLHFLTSSFKDPDLAKFSKDLNFFDLNWRNESFSPHAILGEIPPYSLVSPNQVTINYLLALKFETIYWSWNEINELEKVKIGIKYYTCSNFKKGVFENL